MQAQPTRLERFVALRSRVFDLLVVGGGITGCGIARDAALRGLSVALVEKDDFASGTSSRSSRLVHGGVRYLEHGHLHLVFESSAERRRLLRLAPHLVHPLEFTWPVYAGARIPRWKLRLGLTAYDALALFRNVGAHRSLSVEGVLDREPMLRREGLRGGAMYHDASTNDARLTLANAIGAAQAGAVVLNYAKVTALLFDGGRVSGAAVADVLGHGRVDIRARVVVNATGPWSDAVRELDGAAEPAAAGRGVRGSKGAHIAVPADRIGNRRAVTLTAPADGRVFFVLPAGATTIIGTTDTYTASAPDEVRASNEDVRYLLDAANAFFPTADLGGQDVVAAWAGIRPLIPTHSDSPGAVSREHALTTSSSGVISVTGGKLTTYRVMAADVVDAVISRIAEPRSSGIVAKTARTPLPGGDFRDLDHLTNEIARATQDSELAARLARTFGTAWTGVLAEITATGSAGDGGERVSRDLPYLVGELRYSVRHEMAATLADLLVRRTHVAFETRDHGVAVAERAARAVSDLFGWTGEEERAAVDRYAATVDRLFSRE